MNIFKIIQMLEIFTKSVLWLGLVRRRGGRGALGWSAGFCLAWAVSVSANASTTITVGGVGSITPLMQRLVQQYQAVEQGVQVQLVDPPIGSTGGVRALAAGKLDVVVSGRPLRDNEAGLLQPWLRTPLVLATQGGRLQGLDHDTLVQIFSGQRKTWDDGQPLRLVIRGLFESETQVLMAISPAMKRALEQSVNRHQALMADNDLDAVAKLEKIRGSFGTTSLGLLKTTQSDLTVLPLQGRTPTLEALREGQYPWARPYFLVVRADATPAVQRFVAYLRSPAALDLVQRWGYLPSTR